MSTTRNVETGKMIELWREFLDTAYSSHEPGENEFESYNFALDEIKTMSHKTDRGKGEIARQLDMNVGSFEDLVIGKRVLDIGCGKGKLAEDIARLKRTEVVALDTDPEMLNAVPSRKNITTVQGSGYELEEIFESSEFDVVVSSFSSVLWARSFEQKAKSIEGAYDVTEVGGKTLLVPIISNPIYRHETTQSYSRQIMMPGLSPEQQFQCAEGLSQLLVAGWLDMVALDSLKKIQDSCNSSLDFRANRGNSPDKPLHEQYSVIITK